MRFFIAGILTLWLSAASAFGQARGHVEVIGFDGVFRPGCWTPMVVYLVPTTGSPFSGRLEVVQEDLDKDLVLFTRQFSLTGNAPDGSTREQRFWMYFMPQPTRDLDGQRSLNELTDLIKVRLLSEKGEELIRLPVTKTLQPIEPVRSGMSGTSRGQKLILNVYNTSAANFAEYAQMLGLNEAVQLVSVRDIATGLPDRVIGYDAVDAVLWTDADPTMLSPEQYKALQDYVGRGGRLVICQDTAANQWQRNNAALAPLMPVVVEQVAQAKEINTLANLAQGPLRPGDEPDPRIADTWKRTFGPYPHAVARLKSGAFLVQQSEDIPEPYIVRRPYGAGCVTWVAQDLGSRQLTGRAVSTAGWPRIWDRVFDWPNDPVPTSDKESPRFKAYEPRVSYELGKSLLRYMDLPSTSAALISIAVLFFIIYWVAAGPGSYLVLSRRGRSTLSWFAFAAMAIAATGLTWIIVKLVLGGDAQLQHVSVVRMAPDMPAVVHSDFGLYIPRDGEQKIELLKTAEGAASYVTAFNLHPAFNEESNEFPAKQEYHIPVMEVQEADGAIVADPTVISVPYRSTLKKFQSQWVGTIENGVTAAEPLVLSYEKIATGRILNNTGHDLRHVYVVFHHPGDQRDPESAMPAKDFVLYAPKWDKGTTIDISEVRYGASGSAQLFRDKTTPYNNTTNSRLIRGEIGADRYLIYGFATCWYDKNFRVESFGDREYLENDPLNPEIFPILSFFDRLPPTRNEPSGAQQRSADRVDILRRGLRHLDLSAAISAGQLAVIAVGDSQEQPLPFPMQVHGNSIEGKGVVYYQFVLPIDRTPVADAHKPAATQPATGAATGPATRPVTQPAQPAAGRSLPAPS